ncbi:MAG: UDP-2,3-diacylglucosamine diphosphatase LpxI [Candidatus Aminicenantes bacterium]|nr:UDP-2,3-diacylglucosamine diphosphatase LpxI [Candidatus Aminicenantes bacterium]
MGHRIGIVAGSGMLPFLILEKAKKKDYACTVVGLKGEADPGLEGKAEVFRWIEGGDIPGLISFLKKNGIHEVLMVGKVDQRQIFEEERFDQGLLVLLRSMKDKTPTSLMEALIKLLGREGIRVIDPTPFLSSYFCQEGVMTEFKPNAEMENDIQLGSRMAKKIADLDVGQTVIVKDKTVVAIEGIEGTDETIKRGGELAGKGIVAVKAARTSQDMKIDLPGVGLRTIETLVEVEGAALCIEALKVLFFQKEEAISLANNNKILIMAKEFKDI